MFQLMKMLYCALQFYLSNSFLFDLLRHNLGSFRHHFPFGQVFLHEPRTLILPAEAHVDDQIWIVWKNRTIRFPILDCPVSAISKQSQGRS
jgi:hypothetical protein